MLVAGGRNALRRRDRCGDGGGRRRDGLRRYRVRLERGTCEKHQCEISSETPHATFRWELPWSPPLTRRLCATLCGQAQPPQRIFRVSRLFRISEKKPSTFA